MGRYKNEDEDLSVSFIHTIDVMSRLYLIRHNKAPPVTNHIGHLALWVWTYSIDLRYDRLMLQVLLCVIDDAEREELTGFLKEAILEKNLTLPLHERFVSELSCEYSVDAHLRAVTSILSVVSVHCPPVLHVKTKETDQAMFNEHVARKARGEEMEKTLMQCISIACQRQMCQQEADEYTDDVLGACLSVLREIMQDCLAPGSKRHLATFFDMVDSEKILPMVARITIHTIHEHNPSLFRNLPPLHSGGIRCLRRNLPSHRHSTGHVQDPPYLPRIMVPHRPSHPEHQRPRQ
ncbi:hypothetical protein BDY19DRAFT_724314 [Irpex rosettiformis]|uniref:Uncharacterized protein n=1 Tax=Irpex rosettiformis TaxID=378272 RepID=A0ACB8U8B7_9APHY|nr:hypothetical protein BDY19DRAFT_724314 [Irpex rosettiformis]